MQYDRISHHDSVRKVYDKIKNDNMSNIWDRYESQGLGDDPDKRCQYCQNGTRCDLCSNGPCRADAAKEKRGVCGISADGMAMRMMLLRNVMGASTYQFHTDATIKTLRATAMGKTPFEIKEGEKLRAFSKKLGVYTAGSDNDVALRLCDHVVMEFNKGHQEPSSIVESLAPQERKNLWKKLNIFPGGIYGEMMLSNGSCLTNVDGNYVSLALKAMRLGIAMAYQCQIVNEYCQDILYGIPRPHKMRVDLGVLDPDYINILPNGHEPFLGFAMIDLARKQEWQEKAKSVGAKGLRIIANIEAGQEMIQRWEMDDVFYGFTGNWIMQEAVLASGCVDLFACDMNCSMQIDPMYAEKYRFKLVPLSELVSFEGGTTDRVNYEPEKAGTQAAQLLQMGVDNFKDRKANVGPISELPTKEAVVGFSTESIVVSLGGTLDPLVGAIKSGTIRGIAGMVSCASLRDNGHDSHTVRVVKELIKRDIVVLSMGCGNGAVQVAGLCSPEASEFAGPGIKGMCQLLNMPPVLSYGTCTDVGRIADLLAEISNAFGGVPISDIPVVAAAPEYMEQKATIDAIFALAFGLFTYVNPVPPVTGAPNLVKLLTHDCKTVTGGILNVENDASKAADAMLEHIESNRKNLGI